MSIRWRKDGTLLCAAMHPEEPGDTYIDDRLHYQLSVVTRAIMPSVNHSEDGVWLWTHGERFLRAVAE